jgi:methionyl-tRNA formyltransferase
MPVQLAIIYFGTAEFAVAPLLAILANKERFVVSAVVTQPDRPGDRGTIQRSPVAKAADAHGIPVLQFETLKDDHDIVTLRDLGADLYVVAAYGRIIPQNILEIPAYGAVNLHGSILPKLRGASPIQAAIIEGLEETGVTLMRMDDKMDHGPMLATTAVRIEPTDDYLSMTKKLSDAAAKDLVPRIHDFCSGALTPVPQNDGDATMCGIITKEDGRVRWDEHDAARVTRMLRAFRPWPGVFTEWKKEGGEIFRIKIMEAEVRTPNSVVTPGVVMKDTDGMPVVGTKDGALALLRVLPAGKSEMDGVAFLNGSPGIVGKKLG